MNSRRHCLDKEIIRKMPHLCKAVHPHQLFLAVSVHLHTYDEERLSKRLNSPTPNSMLVYEIIAALKTRSDWDLKFVDALREAQQTEALRIIGEDNGENLDPNERRGDRPEYSVGRSSPSASESFSQRAGNALNQGSCRQTEPARPSPGCSCTRQHSSADVAQHRTALDLAEGLDSLKLINPEQNVTHERLDAGHALQSGPVRGAECESNNILPQQSRNVPEGVTIPAPSPLPPSADMMSTPQSHSVGHEYSSMTNNTQLSEEDNAQQNWNLNHNYQDEDKFSDKEVNDTEEDCGPSTDPVDSNHSNQSHHLSVESAQNDDLDTSLPPEVSTAISAGPVFYIKKIVVKGSRNGVYLDSDVRHIILKGDTPEDIQLFDRSQMAFSRDMPTDISEQTSPKTSMETTNDHGVLPCLARSIPQEVSEDESFELGDTRSVREAIRANQSVSSPSGVSSRLTQLDELKITDENSSQRSASPPAPLPVTCVSESSSSIVVIRESDERGTRRSFTEEDHVDMTSRQRHETPSSYSTVLQQTASMPEARESYNACTSILPTSVQEDNFTASPLNHLLRPEHVSAHLVNAEGEVDETEKLRLEGACFSGGQHSGVSRGDSLESEVLQSAGRQRIDLPAPDMIRSVRFHHLPENKQCAQCSVTDEELSQNDLGITLNAEAGAEGASKDESNETVKAGKGAKKGRKKSRRRKKSAK